MRVPETRSVANGFAAAILTATALPALASLVIAPPLTVLVAIVAFVIASGHALLIALPAYALLSRVWPLRWWSAALGGAVVGAVPIAAVTAGDGPSDVLRTVALLAPLGAASGLAFWTAARPGQRSQRVMAGKPSVAVSPYQTSSGSPI